jgi:hypothetical protein
MFRSKGDIFRYLMRSHSRTENNRVASWPYASYVHVLCQETSLNQVTTTSCYILSNALFITYQIIWPCLHRSYWKCHSTNWLKNNWNVTWTALLFPFTFHVMHLLLVSRTLVQFIGMQFMLQWTTTILLCSKWLQVVKNNYRWTRNICTIHVAGTFSEAQR